jgi:hypothetical protein
MVSTQNHRHVQVRRGSSTEEWINGFTALNGRERGREVGVRPKKGGDVG